MMLDPYEIGIRNATEEPAPVNRYWDGESVYPGDEVWKLGLTGDIVECDTEKMRDYLEYRIKKLGGVTEWIHEDIYEQSAADFILSLIPDSTPGAHEDILTLNHVFEDYYEGETFVAGEEF